MNQKITLRFADAGHVLTFKVPEEEVVKVKQAYRRKWPYKFARADGDFHVNFDQVLWMKVSPGDDVEIELEQEAVQEEPHILFTTALQLSQASGGKHGSL